MRVVAYLAEPNGDEYKYLDLITYFLDLVNTWGFDRACVIDKSNTDYVHPGPGTERYNDWADLIEAYPNAKYVLLTPVDGTLLEDYVEPAGDVVYVLGGDYDNVYNWQGIPDEAVNVPTMLPPGRGTWSFLAMAVVANKVFNA